MAVKDIRDIRVNGFKVVFGRVDSNYLICLPEIECSGYLKPFTEENKHDNIISLTNIFKKSGFRNSVLAFLIITEINQIWRTTEE